MPPKTVVSSDRILDAAFDIVRHQGGAALTARRIAEKLQCSTQPVYTAWESMDLLKAKVATRIKRFLREQLESSPDEGISFLQFGYETLRLAREEPHLFHFISELMRDRVGKKPSPVILKAMRTDHRLATLSLASLTRVHSLLWLLSQGIATLFGPESTEANMSVAREYLKQGGEAMIEFEFRNQNRNAQ